MLSSNTALLIIDVQKGLDDPQYGNRCNPHAESVMQKVLQHWRDKARPVIYVQHLSSKPNSPIGLGAPGCDFKDEVAPREGEPIFQKNVNSAFIGTDLEPYLRDNGIDSVVAIGLTTSQCVSTTVRMAGNLGFDTYVVADATACFGFKDHNGEYIDADLIQKVSLANLHDEFATIITSADILDS